MDSTSPRYGEKASYYSAVCLETGEVEWMELEGNNNSETSAAFLEQLRERHSSRLNVIWDNAPAHRGEAVRAIFRGCQYSDAPRRPIPAQQTQGVNRYENTKTFPGNLCPGTASAVAAAGLRRLR